MGNKPPATWDSLKGRVSHTRLMDGDKVSFQVVTPDQVDNGMKANQYGRQQMLINCAVTRNGQTIRTRTYLSLRIIIEIHDAGGFEPFKEGSSWGVPVLVRTVDNQWNKRTMHIVRIEEE